MCQTEGDTSGNDHCVPPRTARSDACLPSTRVEEEENVAEIRLPSRSTQRASRAQKVAAISLVFFVVVTVGVRYSQLGDLSSWWSVGELQEIKARDVTEGQHPYTEKARTFRPWCRRTKRMKPSSTLVEATLHERQDPGRGRKGRRAPPPEASPEVGQKPEKRKRAESPREHRLNVLHSAWKLWKRVFMKGRGRQHGVDRALGAGAEAEEKMRILKELRDEVRRHPGDILRRAREVRHELDDGVLIRYLELGFWSLEPGGTPLTNAIESTVRWREEMAPHLITDADVVEEARNGKIYVRGHDRDGRPIIFFTPGLEKSFNTREGLKLLYHTLEKATALLPRGQTQFAVVADCAGFGPSKLPPLEMINIAFSTLQEHYTMRLGYVIIVNASGPITVAWKLVSSVLAERTKQKVVFVTRKEASAVLSRHIDPSLLPSTLPGGLDNFRYSNDAYLST